MNKVFEHLCTLIDEFWQEQTYSKPGAKPKQFDDFYLKLYWFAILYACTVKYRVLQRAEALLPHLFKKNLHNALFHDECRILSLLPGSFGGGSSLNSEGKNLLVLKMS